MRKTIADHPADANRTVFGSINRLVKATHLYVDTLGLLMTRRLTREERRQVDKAVGKELRNDDRAHPIARAHGWNRTWPNQSLTFRQIKKLAAVLDGFPMLDVIVNRLDPAFDFRTATGDDAYAIDAILTGHIVIRPRRATQRLFRDRATMYHGRKWAATNFVHYCHERAQQKMGGMGCHSELRVRGTSATRYYGISDLKQVTRANCIALFDKVAAWVEHSDPEKFDADVEAFLENEIDRRMAAWDARLDTPVTGRDRQQLRHRVRITIRRKFAKLMFSRAVEDDDLDHTNWHRRPLQNALAAFPQFARKSAIKRRFALGYGLIRERGTVSRGSIRANQGDLGGHRYNGVVDRYRGIGSIRSSATR